jgi:very-short-patch-repair endonuclease
MSSLEIFFIRRWCALAPNALLPVSEYRFCERLWRFDFVWLDAKVAVECEGGTWKQTKTGRSAGHAHPARFEKDCEKYNRATADGWRVFRCTAGMLERDPAAFVEMVLRAIQEATT